MVDGDDFGDIYDDETRAALDAWGTKDPGPRPLPSRMKQWGRTSALGAVLTGFALGIQEVLDPPEEHPIVIEVDDDEGLPRHLPVELFLDPDSARGSLCIVRREAVEPPLV